MSSRQYDQRRESIRTSSGVASAPISTHDKDSRSLSVWHIGGDDLRYRIPMMLRLRESGINVTAVGAEGSEPFVRHGIPFHPYPLIRKFSPRADYRAMLTLTSLFRDFNPQVVHAFHTKPSVIAMLAAEKAGVPVRIRSVTGMGYIFASRRPTAVVLRPVYRQIQKKTSRVTHHTIFQNQDDHDYFLQHEMVSDDHCSVIPGSGIDAQSFKPTKSKQQLAAQASLNLPEGPTVTMVSRMVRHKGVIEFLKAASIVKRQMPQTNFLLVGGLSDDPLQRVSLKEIESYGDVVRYVGHRDDIKTILGMSDAFVLPTFYREGVPRSLLEACAAGLPVVTTRMPGCVDVVKHGHNGLLVEPRSVDELATAVKQLLLNRELRESMGVAGQQLVVDRFDISSVADQYVQLYHHFSLSGDTNRQ